VMAKKSKYHKFDEDFKQGAVALVLETGLWI
jgi:transposase-like protein